MTGLHRQLLDADGRIVPAAWKQAVDTIQMVGICPSCNGPLRPEKIIRTRYIDWYNATCVYCGREVAAPNGATLAASRPQA